MNASPGIVRKQGDQARSLRKRAIGLMFVALAPAAMQSSPPAAEGTASRHTAPEIIVMSNRADLVSGGDVLVEILLPANVDPAKIRVDVDGRDVTSAFALRSNGRFMGVVTQLDEGDSVLTAVGHRGSSRITITNHPIGGPIFSGPQVQPWVCATEEAGLGSPQDAQCNALPKVEFLYRSTDPLATGLQPYDADNPPPDVASTTTDQGHEVPFIVRLESGSLNRGIYQIAILDDPARSFTPWEPQPGWNHKLYYTFGGGVAPHHRQGSPPSVLDGPEQPESALARGWAVATASLNTLGQNTNIVTSAETVMMVKERVTEQFGEIRFTVGAGRSGGSLQQQAIASTYPGLLDGIQPTNSYMDVYTSNTEIVDCSLLERVFNQPSDRIWPVEVQRAAVSGHLSAATCVAWVEGTGTDRTLNDPGLGCTMGNFDGGHVVNQEPEWVYDPQANPDGARCTLQDYQVAMFGRRASDGFANRPFDNVGVQYGLRALESGIITPGQFADLNERIGGYDIDLNWQAERSAADPYALEVAYRTGMVTHGGNLASVPIIDQRRSGNGEIHTDFRSWAMRARLLQANGHYGNHIIWTGPPPAQVDESESVDRAFLLIDEWLTAIEADTSADAVEAKVIKHRPAAAVDTCWIAGHRITDQAMCRTAFPYFASTRIAAGGPFADDILKCHLKPQKPSDYDVNFTDEQWSRLQQAFPTGVCDWTRPGASQHPPTPWLTFAGGPGGEPLGEAPRSSDVQGR